MAKLARSARGETIDFDVLAIMASIADAPVPSVVQARREFIDEKDGVRTRNKSQVVPVPETNFSIEAPSSGDAIDALALAKASVEISAAVAKDIVSDDIIKDKKITK